MAISDKLTYLNDTKIQLKDMINYGLNTGEKITSETTFRNYVKSLFDAFIKTMTYPDVLYNNLPKVTGEGTSVTLNDTVYAPMRVELSPSALEQETSILPSEYTQVDYIESTGTQYIDTGVKPSSDTKIDIDFAYLDSTYNGYTALFGERGATGDTYFGLYINKTDGKLAINYSKYDGGTSSTTTISRNVKYNIKNDYGSFYLNNASTPFQETTQTLTTSAISVYLLEQHLYNGSVQSRGMQAKIYQCKFYEGSTLTRNFIPCYRNSDNEIGMYDLVNEVFYTNAGTGTFVKGNNSVLPNPDYPQEIHTVSGDNTIKIKNIQVTHLNGYVSVSSSKGIFKTDTDDSMVFPVIQGHKYIIHNSGNRNRGAIFENIPTNNTYCIDGTYNASIPTDTEFEASASGYLVIYINTPNSQNVVDDFIAYEVGKNQSLPLSLGDLEYCKIGDYEDGFIRTSGKNLFDKDAITDGKWLKLDGTEESSSNYCISDYIEVSENKQYYLPAIMSKRLKYYNSNKQALTNEWDIANGDSGQAITIPTNAKYVRFSILKTSIDINTFMFNKGSTALPYEPYGSGEWYLKKNVGKVVLNGSEDWTRSTDGNKIAFYINMGVSQNSGYNYKNERLLKYSDNFKYEKANWRDATSPCICENTNSGNLLIFRYDEIGTATWQTWLSTHNTTVYYVLATPTYTLLSDTLQTQLEAIWKANSYQEQTNVSQTNADLPFVISASAIRDLSGIFEEI